MNSHKSPQQIASGATEPGADVAAAFPGDVFQGRGKEPAHIDSCREQLNMCWLRLFHCASYWPKQTLTSRLEAIVLLQDVAKKAEDASVRAAEDCRECAEAANYWAQLELACLIEAVNHEERAQNLMVALGWQQAMGQMGAIDGRGNDEGGVKCVPTASRETTQRKGRKNKRARRTTGAGAEQMAEANPNLAMVQAGGNRTGASAGAFKLPTFIVPSSTLPSCETKRRRGRPRGSSKKTPSLTTSKSPMPVNQDQVLLVDAVRSIPAGAAAYATSCASLAPSALDAKREELTRKSPPPESGVPELMLQPMTAASLRLALYGLMPADEGSNVEGDGGESSGE